LGILVGGDDLHKDASRAGSNPSASADDALARVVAAWAELPEAVRSAVLLLVDSAGKRPHCRIPEAQTES